MIIATNSLIKYPNASKEYSVDRVLYIDAKLDLAITIFIYDKKAYPRKRTYSILKKQLKSGKITVLESDPLKTFLDSSKRPQFHLDLRDNAWVRIKTLVTLENGQPNLDIFSTQKRGKLVQKVAEQFGTTKKTIYHGLRKYWQRGQTIDALLPDFILCGGKGQNRYKNSKKKIGRRSTFSIVSGITDGIPLDATVKNKFTRVLDVFHRGKTSLSDTYQHLLETYFFTGYENKDGVMVPIIAPVDQRPTFRQFENYYYKNWEKDIAYEQQKKYGKHRYTQNYSPAIGDTTQMAMGPGSIFQLDSTILDTYLVSSLDRARIIGRPVLYVLIDVFSRLVVGFALMLQGPSWEAARFAFENMATDKVKFCHDFGITISESDWPAHHLPYEIISDRGESVGKNGENLPANLGITISSCPPFFPRWKPLVERRFKTINDDTIKWDPAYVNKDFIRGDKDYRLSACHTLQEMRGILIHTFLFHNRFSRLKNIRNDKFIVIDKVPPYSIDIWNWGIENRSGKLREMDPDLVRMNLLPKKTAHVTERGIFFQGRQYDCEYAHQQNWYDRARARGRWAIDIFYQQHVANRIYLRLDNGTFTECHLHANEKVSMGQDWYELIQQDTTHLQMRPVIEAEERQGKATLNAQRVAITEPAYIEAKEARRGMSKKSQINNIRANRKEELVIEEVNDNQTIPDISTTQSETPPGGIGKLQYIPPDKHIDIFKELDDEDTNGN